MGVFSSLLLGRAGDNTQLQRERANLGEAALMCAVSKRPVQHLEYCGGHDDAELPLRSTK